VVAAGGEAIVNQVLLINTAITSRRHARFPLSIMTMAAALEGRYESTLIDGNIDRDARATACDAILAQEFIAVGITVSGVATFLRCILTSPLTTTTLIFWFAVRARTRSPNC
jgi:hypothetical protein